jgi:hypothetical protein
MGTSIATVLALSLLSVVGPAAWVDTLPIAPDPSQVYIESLSFSGTGSPAGSLASDLSSDGKAMTVIYDSFSVTTVKKSSSASKKSTMLISMHVPEGWSYTPCYIDVRGYANVSAKATATETTKYSMKKSHGGWGGSYPLSSYTVKGPFDGSFFQRGATPIVQWSPLGAMTSILRIDTTIKVSGPPSHMSIDSIDGSLDQTVGLAWRYQPPSGLSAMLSPLSVPEPGILVMLAGIALTALLYWWRKHV